MRPKKIAISLTFLLNFFMACSPIFQKSQTNFALMNPSSYPLWFKKEINPTATWGQEEFQSKKIYFRNYLKGPKSPLPLFTNQLILNCLDYVVYSALKFNFMTQEEAWKIYERRSRGESLESVLFPFGSKKITYIIENKKVKFQNLEDIESLDIVLMDGPSHVVQAVPSSENTNLNLEFVSFSPRPIWGDGSSESNLENITPELTTLESLIEEMIELYPDVPSDWIDINIVSGRPFWIKN
ncbi:MAG: hypothetical protein WCI18_15975 [Pseudomonadota bacterium]